MMVVITLKEPQAINMLGLDQGTPPPFYTF